MRGCEASGRGADITNRFQGTTPQGDPPPPWNLKLHWPYELGGSIGEGGDVRDRS